MKNVIPLGLILAILLFSHCSDFLEKKPDIKMRVPRSIVDAELLLNNYDQLNKKYILVGEMGSDDYWLLDNNWIRAEEEERNAYNWLDEPYKSAVDWQTLYQTVYLANQALDLLKENEESDDPLRYRSSWGAAHFYWAFTFLHLLEIYAPAYAASTAAGEMGIPLKLSPGITESSTRASLQASYAQVIVDFEEAAKYLKPTEGIIGRPNQAAAYAGLARAYLNMGDYEKAYQAATAGLAIHDELMDFNLLIATDVSPILRFNAEVLFSATASSNNIMSYNNAFVDSLVTDSYAIGDLRKKVFLEESTDQAGAYRYKGNYDNTTSSLFLGLTTSELYIVQAEAAARTNKVPEALAALNTLLQSRWDATIPYVAITESDPEKLLPIILQERRKELVFRGRRWADLKRLNLDPRFAKTLTRSIEGKTYTLAPNSPLYAFRLPEDVVNLGKVPQNKR